MRIEDHMDMFYNPSRPTQPVLRGFSLPRHPYSPSPVISDADRRIIRTSDIVRRGVSWFDRVREPKDMLDIAPIRVAARYINISNVLFYSRHGKYNYLACELCGDLCRGPTHK